MTLGRYATSWLIVIMLAHMWAAYFFLTGCLDVSHATQQEVEAELGEGAHCTPTSAGNWDCTYPVLLWQCSQAGGFSAKCIPKVSK